MKKNIKSSVRSFLLLVFCFLFFFSSFPVSADDVAVTASINPQPSDFQLSISSTPDSATTVNQNQNIIFTITYGSHLFYATPMTLVASWGQGTINGQGSPSVNIADYVVGSASNAYNNTAPVVDTVNRTITWSITSFPSQTTNQTVSFTLQTNTSYTGALTVTFPATAHLSVSNVTIPDQTETMTYQYNPAITPSPTPGPTNTPTPGPTATPSISPEPTNTPTPIPQTFPPVTNVAVETISSTDATVVVTTTTTTSMFLTYGTSQQFLTLTSDIVRGKQHRFHLTNLHPQTNYYFRANEKTDTENISTELFIFKTSATSSTTSIITSSVIVTSEKILLYDPLNNQNNRLQNTVVIPIGASYEFTFALEPPVAKQVVVFLRNNRVLGASTFDNSLPSDNLTVVETAPGTYTGRLSATSTPGDYELMARVFDTTGNITEISIVRLKVVNTFSIFDETTKKPIDHAQISLAMQDTQTRKFIPITPQILAINNPLFSTLEGTVPIILPQGIYQADVQALGYKEKNITFTIGAGKDEEYPQVGLARSFFALDTVSRFVTTTIKDCITVTDNYFADFGGSKRFFVFFSFLTSLLFILIVSLSLGFRIGIPFYLLPWYLWYQLKHTFRKSPIPQIRLQVVDEDTHKHIPHTFIDVIDADKNHILFKRITNHIGECFFPQTECTKYNIAVLKDGYELHPFFSFIKDDLQKGIVFLPIKHSSEIVSNQIKVFQFLQYVLSLCFEFFLLITFVFLWIFSIYLGIFVTLPFLIFALSNMLLWLLHMYAMRKK